MILSEFVLDNELTEEKAEELRLMSASLSNDAQWVTIELFHDDEDFYCEVAAFLKVLQSLKEENFRVKYVIALDDSIEDCRKITVKFYDSEPILNSSFFN